jgi:hypothetical protein
VKVRITETPHVQEVDGVTVDRFRPGEVRELSSSLASWLIAEQYAEPEMRRDPRGDAADDFSGMIRETRRQHSNGVPRRRADDR